MHKDSESLILLAIEIRPARSELQEPSSSILFRPRKINNRSREHITHQSFPVDSQSKSNSASSCTSLPLNPPLSTSMLPDRFFAGSSSSFPSLQHIILEMLLIILAHKLGFGCSSVRSSGSRNQKSAAFIRQYILEQS